MKVERIEIVSATLTDDAVLLKRGPKIQEVAQRFRGTVTTLNAPDRAPADLPRAIVRFPDALLQIAPSRVQVVMEPPQHVQSSYEEAMSFALNRSQPLIEALCDSSQYQWTGIVCVLAFPQNLSQVRSGIQAAWPLFSRLTTLEWSEKNLATFELKVGSRHRNFFRNYSLAGYEVRQLEIVAPPGSRVAIDLSGGDLVEVGLNVSVDVNNKPSEDKTGAIPDLEATAQELGAALRTLADDLNLRGLL